jgi:predicted dehydrogenase
MELEAIKMANVLIIGCGKVSGEHYSSETPYACHGESYSRNPLVEDLYFYDPILDKAEKLAELFQGTSLSKLEESKSLEIDIVCVNSPPAFHVENIKDILSLFSPKVIIVEKPVCNSDEELNDLIKMNKEIPIIVNQSWRYGELLSFFNNDLGHCQFITIKYYGGLSNIASHSIDLLNQLGFTNFKVLSSEKAFNSKRHKEFSFNAQLTSGKTKVELKALDESFFQIHELDFIFNEGRILVEDFAKKVSVYEVIKNNLGEKVLALKERKELPEESFDKLIEFVLDSLSSKEALQKHDVTTVAETMKLLWEIKERG